ncbi:tyrosine-type recombinase/integrase [Vibrio sp. DNB22_12_1]
MAKIIVVKEVNLGGEVIVQGEQMTSLSIGNSISLEFVPTLYCQQGKYVEPVNHWFIYLKSVKRLEDLNSYSRALLRYWNFLEKNQLCWDDIPEQKALKPTYQFRNLELIPAIKEGRLKSSTANTYIRHVVQFYAWAMYEQVLKVPSKQLPFRVENVSIKAKGILSHIKPHMVVQTSDLRIREPNRNVSNGVGGLNPLSIDEAQLLFAALNEQSIEFSLMGLLACCSGLRASEVCSLTLQSLQTAKPTSDIKNRFTLTIGPKYGVNTKYLKERNVEISSLLLSKLNDYTISERRFNRLEKYQHKFIANKTPLYEPIFISQQGNKYSTKSLAARWGEFRKKLQIENPSFNYKFHDLRSTYATYRIGDLLDSGIGEYDAVDTLMGYMGHNQESTLWKYIRYRRRREAISEKFTILDKLMNEVCDGE